jgi:outer membrane protein TolC
MTFITPLSADEVEKDNKKPLKVTIEEAAEMGVKNSIDLKLVKSEIELSGVKKSRSKYFSDKLEDGDDELSDGRKALSAAQQQIDALPDSPQKQKLQEQLNQKEAVLQAGESDLISALQQSGSTISNALNFNSLDILNVSNTTNLMTTMANISYEVTNASYDIYKNKIDMLIRKSYYDVLKAKKILEVKEKAQNRGRKQFEFAKAGYEEGLKSKDDMLIADIYYKSTQVQYKKAKGEYNNSILELKKNMNIPLDTEIILEDALAEDLVKPDLEEGLKSGFKNRLEMKKAVGEVAVNELNFNSVSGEYTENTFQYREAKVLRDKARYNYEKTRVDVDNSIRQSYELLMATGDMMTTAKKMVASAKESLNISEYKYKEGIGVETSLLKKLDIEATAGTIVEVLAAEENLANVEEKVIEIVYGYNLSKVKYYNDIGKLN